VKAVVLSEEETVARGPDAPGDDPRLVEALRRGDEAAFSALVERHHPSMLRLARLYLPDPVSAEEAVQDAWLGVLRGLRGFEGRSSLKTWIFRILVNRAKTRRRRDRSLLSRTSPLPGIENDPDAWPRGWFRSASDPLAPHHWARFPPRWQPTPEDGLLSRELRARLEEAIRALPPIQQQVITLRDVEGWSAEDVCNVLDLRETNQRVLLHRARARVRRALARHLGREDAE